MSKELAAENEGVLETLKQPGKKVALEELISLILNREVSRKEAKLFLDERFGKEKIDWLQMTHDEIYELALKAKKYKKDNQEKWRQERLAHERQLQERELLRKEQERLRLQMIKKNMTRQAMIKLVQESIQKCERIMLTSKDQQEYARLKKSVQDLRRELFILQGKYFEQMDVHQLPENNDEQIDPELYKRIKAIKDKKLQEIEQARRDKEKKQNMRLESIAKNLSNSKGKVQQIFEHYAHFSANKGITFDDRKQINKVIDLKLFLQFIKDFSITNKVTTVYDTSNIFKKLATNSLWMKIEQFQSFIYWLYKRQRPNMQKKKQDEVDIDLTQYLNQGICHPSKMDKVLDPIEKTEVNNYDFYSHSGMIKQDIQKQIKRRKQQKELKKKEAFSLKKKSLSLPSIYPKIFNVNQSPMKASVVTNSTFAKKALQSKQHSKELENSKSKLQETRGLDIKPKQLRKIHYSTQLTRKYHQSPMKDKTQTQTLHRSIYDQLKSFDGKYNDKYIQKLIGIKNDEQDQFLKELIKGRPTKKAQL